MSELRALGTQYPLTPHEPPDRRSLHASRSGDDGGWMLHMERAQFADWFRSSPPVGTTVPAMAPAPLAVVTVGQPAPLPTEIALHQTAYQVPAPQPATDHILDNSSVDVHRIMPARRQSDTFAASASLVELRTQVSQKLAKALSRVPASDVLTQASEMDVATEPQRLSIHLEPHADGVWVAAWIGVNTHDPVAKEHLATLRDTLVRNLHENGLRLGALTLNGRLVWQAHVHKENN